MVRVEREIDGLWHEALANHDHTLAERFAELGHALRRAARLVEDERAIG